MNGNRSYAFMLLNSWPYLVADYFYGKNIPAVDRSLVNNQLTIDTSDAYSTVVDITIDGIGSRSRSCRSLYADLIKSIRRNFVDLRGHLNLVQPGIRVVVDYQVETERTGVLLKKASAEVYLNDCTDYVDMYTDTNGDVAILSRFSGSVIRTIRDRVVGNDRLIVRITGIKLYRQVLKRPKFDHRKFCNENHDIFGFDDPYERSYHRELSVPQWFQNSMYYHFQDKGESIELNKHEIDKRTNNVAYIQIGHIHINRAFPTSTSYRVIFRFNVWRNDLVVLNSTKKVAKALLGIKSKKKAKPSLQEFTRDDVDRILLLLRKRMKKRKGRRIIEDDVFPPEDEFGGEDLGDEDINDDPGLTDDEEDLLDDLEDIFGDPDDEDDPLDDGDDDSGDSPNEDDPPPEPDDLWN